MYNPKQLIILAAVAGMLNACTSKPSNETLSGDYTNLSGTIDTTTAKRYVGNYEPRAGHVKKGQLTASGTRCVWFSIGQMDSLVRRIKSEHGDGIRFYFAAYDSTYNIKSNGPHIPLPNYWGYNTLVMVSTEARNGNHFDYYTPKAATGADKARGIAIAADPQNQGELCPPPEKCDGIGATLIVQ